MKKLNVSLLALLSLLAFAFTSCEEEENKVDFVTYTANFQVIAVGGDISESLEVGLWGTQYNEAIASLMQLSGREDDAAVIKACDAVYAKHKASPAYKYAKGTVEINKYRGLASKPNEQLKPERVIKTYSYNE